MSAPAIKFPLDFERRGSLRLLVRKLEIDASHALAIAVRIWMDWAIAGVEARSLRRVVNDNVEIDWTKEDLTYVIEGGAGWHGASGDLIAVCIDSGFIVLRRSPGKNELLLDGFWPLNEHLSPDFKSIQQRGGKARQALRYREEGDRAAAERQKAFELQGVLPFGSVETTGEEQKFCYALFIRLHRICGLDIPLADRFSTQAMTDALYVVRNYTAEQIQGVEEWIFENRERVDVVKLPDRILENFGKYAAKAGIL